MKRTDDMTLNEVMASAKALRDDIEAEGRQPTHEEVLRLEEYKDAAEERFIPEPKTKPGAVRTAGVHSYTTGNFGFASLGEQCLAAMQWEFGHRDERLKLSAAALGHNRGEGVDGSFALAPEFSNQILSSLSDGSDSLLSLTRQFVITGRSLELPKNGETSRADGSRSGGIQGYWGIEAGSLTSSQSKLESLTLEPSKLHVLSYATDEVLSDSSILEDWILGQARDELDFKIGDAIVNGDGVGKPRGILLNESKVQVAKETSQAAVTFNEANAAKMFSRMHPSGRNRAVWLINNDVVPQLLNMHSVVPNRGDTDDVGGYAGRFYDPISNTLLGRPVRVVEYCATLGTAGDVIFWDPMRYISGVAGPVKSARSIHLKFLTDEVAFRWTVRIDGQCQDDTALTPFKGSTTTSSIVDLAVRA